MKPTKVFTELLTPFSWATFYLGFLPTFIIIFRPSAWDLLLFFAIDSTALAGVVIFDRWAFRALWPDSAAYFPEFQPEKLAEATESGRTALFQSLTQFPRRRALFCALVSYLKCIPVLFLMVFYWPYSGSPLFQAGKALAVFTLIYCYFHGALYFEFHQRVSQVLAALHAEQDWSETFAHAVPNSLTSNFDTSQVLSVAAIWISMAIAQSLVILGATVEGQNLAGEIFAISLSGLLLFTRLWYLERNYFVGGLRSLFVTLERFNPQVLQRNLALHSSPILAQFERTFNAMMDRLRRSERELSHWIFSVSEQSRFRALGETSGLVVHDLGTPLQVVAFCAQQLIEDPRRIQNPRYVEQLNQNTNRALELIQSWKAYLKNQESTDQHSNLEEAFTHVKKLLATQIEPFQFNSIQLSVDPKLALIEVKLPRAELIHIVVNLLTNSFNNLIQNPTPDAVIRIRQVAKDEETITLSVEDNGTGLSPNEFERLTAFEFLPKTNERTRGGMGLRLVRRLIEQNGGDLSAIAKAKGTELRLKLPLSTRERDGKR